MPHGYECDRCETFVDQGVEGRLGREHFPENQGPTEYVHVVPGGGDSDTFEMFEWTLCDGCRNKLVEFVENPIPDKVLQVNE